MGWFKSAEEKKEDQKKELIEKYGEEDGMMIFNGEITEERYLRKKELIEKYGVKEAQLIFEDKISEQEILNKKEKENNHKIILDYLNEEGVIEKGWFVTHLIKSERPKLENTNFMAVMDELVEEKILYQSPFETLEGSSIPTDRGWLNNELFEHPNAYCTKEFLKQIIEYDLDMQQRVISLLEEKSIKMPVSDIAAFLKEDFDKVKDYCESLYKEGKIDFAGNGRYFILSDDSSKPKTKATSSKKTDTTDVKAELEKYKQMLDEGLIEQADFDAKKKELLGL